MVEIRPPLVPAMKTGQMIGHGQNQTG